MGNQINNKGGPSLTERPEQFDRSQPRMEDQIRALGQLQPGTIIGSIVGGTLTVGKDQVNRIGNPGTGCIIAHMAQKMHIGGKQTYEFGSQGEMGPSKDPTSDDTIFKTMTASEGGCYELKNSSCALIINNIFHGPQSQSDPKYKANYRKGAEGDTAKLKSLFCHLKFSDIQTEQNVTLAGLGEILENFRSLIKQKGYSSCFIIIMSHGGSGDNSILMDDLKDVDLYKDIVYKFSNHEDVRDLPKVFLVQACRNSGGPPVVGSGIAKPAELQDLLVGHSTSPHLPAARNTKTGTVYIDVLCEVFRKSAQTLSLASLLYEVYNHKSLKKRQQYPPVELFGFRDYRFKL